MPERTSFGHIQLEVALGKPQAAHRPGSDTPFQILVLGDFSGRSNRGLLQSLAGRKPYRLDTENFDQVLGRLGAELHLPGKEGANSPTRIGFKQITDFHPDRLFERLDVLAPLRQLRKRLLDSSTSAQAIAEIRAWLNVQPGAPAPQTKPEAKSVTPAESQDDTIQRLLGKPRSSSPDPTPTRGPVDISGLIKHIVEPHVVRASDPQRDTYEAALDAVCSQLMRAIVHYPDLQSLEAAWRGLDFLVRNIELEENLRLYVWDVSKEELAADLSASENLTTTQAYKLLVEQAVRTPGGVPWAVVAGLYTCDHTRSDAEFLGRLAKIAFQAGAPFIAEAEYHSFAENAVPPNAEDQEAWQALRNLPEASYIGLALPRFLLRLPYGKSTDATERFDFEENPPPLQHERYLWGNPALACVCLLGQSFTESGWDLSPGDVLALGGLPAHVYKEGGESKMTPCAEVWLSDAGSEGFLDRGLMPFFSIRGRDAIRLARFQSLQQPAATLYGRWE